MPAYSGKAQPYLDAFAATFFADGRFRDWVIAGTSAEPVYTGASVPIDEQKETRWRTRRTKQPFWANYWCGKDSACTCRIEGSKGLESDAIFFLRNSDQRTLAVHLEYKHPGEAFGYGQPEAYPLRAACFARTHKDRPTMLAHDDWTTVLICGSETLADARISCFARVITHDEACERISCWPRG
jgi:hypothetical protein